MDKIFITLCLMVGLVGCSNNSELGKSVAYLKAEQTYNPNATEENLGVLPEGSGERAQASIKGYNKGASKNISIGSGFSN
ncbi:hypothetical protein [Vibrio gallicus]|uniref:hypothetical protein n=1 Tax=Vibrio gallicus TaxID=190897 RepID=UPI0021C3624C|nr:hypothetical protein [Vibrio gallicus]